MAISSIPTTPVAFRTPSGINLNAATQPSSAPQQTGRTHHHQGGKGGNLLTASTAQSGSTETNGTLLNTLV